MRLSKISNTIQWALLGLIILTSFALMLISSSQESAIMDELAHIPAGYSYVRFFDYRLNPEHPPLLKAIAALPLLLGNFNFPTSSSNWKNDVNGQWAVGEQFLYESGNNADKIIQWSRIAPMLITLLLVLFIYISSRELIGRWWALLPTFLFALSPTVLAHGHYVTTDVAAALGIFSASHYLSKYLFNPSRKHLLYAGLAFGIAQLMKFSAILLIPFFGFIVLIFHIWKTRYVHTESNFAARLVQFLKSLIKAVLRTFTIFIIGYFLVYAIYFVFTINYPIEKQQSDTKFILTSFADGPDPKLTTCNLGSKTPIHRRLRCLAEVDILMAGSRVLRPAVQYMLGVLMVLQRSSGGNTAYFLGEVSSAGWWYYFPVVFFLKEPLPSLIIVLIAFALSLWSIVKKFLSRQPIIKTFFDYLGTNFAEFSMITFVIFYWIYSMRSPLNIGFRHILPTLPFIYILSASALKKWVARDVVVREKFWRNIFSVTTSFLKSLIKKTVIVILVAWSLAETLFAFPYFISYFNELGGGVKNGYQYVTDSNYDWGQDLKRLKDWVEKNKIPKIAIDYFGGGNPQYYLGGCSRNSGERFRNAGAQRAEARFSCAEYWSSSKGNPKDIGINWLALSVNTLQGAKGRLHPGQTRDLQDEYSWLSNPYMPYARAGTSIFIYKL